MVLQSNTTVHLNFILCERGTPQIPTPHPNQNTALTAPLEITKLQIHSAPTGTPNRQLSNTKSRWSHQCSAISRNIFVLYVCSWTNNASHTEHNFIWTIKKHPGDIKKLVQILNYSDTHPEAITCYHASRMTLHIHSDVSFLSVPGAKIRAGGYH